MENKICSICYKKYAEWGNDAWPVNNGGCCDLCDVLIVFPARNNRRIIINKFKQIKTCQTMKRQMIKS